MTQDRPFLGILLMLAFCLLIPLGDSLAKLLGPLVSVGMLVFVRFAFQTIVLVPIAIATKREWNLKGRLFWLAYARALLQVAGIGCMFTALLYLPLADAVAIAFVMPFIMLLLGWGFLNEPVGAQRLLACAVGFIGTLLVIQPNFAAAGWAVLYPLAAAVFFAAFMLITRMVAKQTDPIGLQGLNGVMGCVTLAPIFVVGSFLDIPFLMFKWPSADTMGLLIIMGVVGTIAHLLMTWSLRFAPSTVLAPMQYLEIPVATLYGFFLFDELPNRLAAFGICVTIASGLFIIFREQANQTAFQAESG